MFLSYFCKKFEHINNKKTMKEDEIQQMATQFRILANRLIQHGRIDLMLKAIGVSTLEQLRIEAARSCLSRLLITRDFRFILIDYNNLEIDMSPIHKALYMLFLDNPDGIELKRLSEYRQDIYSYYIKNSSWIDKEKVENVVDRLVNPLDNAINEKCSRIKVAFSVINDEYAACYYIISSHKIRHISESSRIWYERKKIITLPRELVIKEFDNRQSRPDNLPVYPLLELRRLLLAHNDIHIRINLQAD